MALLKAENLSIGYEGSSVADNISFEIKGGEYICVVGENGAGKSTLVKTILKLQKPLSGRIEYGAGRIGYLPQQTNIQKDFPASVWEIVLSGNVGRRGILPFYSAADKENTKKCMEKMGILELKDMCYRNLSGGQKQRVLLARALCASSDMLVLDEPVNGLDPKVTAELYRMLSDLNKEGMTIIMVSHDVASAMKYAGYIMHVEKDETFFGSVEQYRKSSLYKMLAENADDEQKEKTV